MNYSLGEERPLRYAQDITGDDVEGVQAFLMAQTEGLARSVRGSDERQAARALRAGMVVLAGTLRHSLTLLDPAGTGGSSAAPADHCIVERFGGDGIPLAELR